MKYIDLEPQYQAISESLNERLKKIYAHAQFILGPEVSELESVLAEYVGVDHCVTVSSGTTALTVALMALDIGPEDEVVTTPFSFFGTVEVIKLLGAKPVFVDIDINTFNLDPNLLAASITPKTKAILPVSLYGQCADYDVINKIAGEHGIPVIEDGAQSFGATHNGRRSCGLTTIGCTSFFPSKPLGCYGDGGACFTDDAQLAKKIRMIINHGQDGRYHHVMFGINGRFDTIQAAVLLAKLPLFRKEIELRLQVADFYNQQLKEVTSIPFVAPNNKSVFAQYTIRLENRDAIRCQLKEKQIPTAVHYPKSLHQLPIVTQEKCHFPMSEKASKTVLSLPFYPYMPKEKVDQVVTCVKECIQ